MHLPADPISTDWNAIDRSCLSLPLVSARDRDQRMRSTRSMRPIGSCTPPASRKSCARRRRAGRARWLPAARLAGSRFEATTRKPVPPSGSSASARWTIPMPVRRDIHIYISSKQPWVTCQQAVRRLLSSTISMPLGRLPVWSACASSSERSHGKCKLGKRRVGVALTRCVTRGQNRLRGMPTQN